MEGTTFKESIISADYKYQFADSELLEFGQKLAEKNRELEQLELDKKSSASTFKSRIESKQSEAKNLANYLQDRFKWQLVDAKRIPNIDLLEWEIRHPENNELIYTEKFTNSDIKAGFPKRKDIQLKKMVWYHPATGEVLHSRDLEPSEYQLEMDGLKEQEKEQEK